LIEKLRKFQLMVGGPRRRKAEFTPSRLARIEARCFSWVSEERMGTQGNFFVVAPPTAKNSLQTDTS